MKGSDKVEMTINIGGEFLKLSADYDQQNLVREAEFAVKKYYNQLRREWPDSSDRQILAMAAYQFSFWYKELLKIHNDAVEIAHNANQILGECLDSDIKP